MSMDYARRGGNEFTAGHGYRRCETHVVGAPTSDRMRYVTLGCERNPDADVISCETHNTALMRDDGRCSCEPRLHA
eukprot:3351678-Prymnesium_polylepis.2